MNIPRKCQLVPIEPTEEILEAMADAFKENCSKEMIDNWLHLRPMYEAALRAWAKQSDQTISLENMIAEFETDPQTKEALEEARKTVTLEGMTITDLDLPIGAWNSPTGGTRKELEEASEELRKKVEREALLFKGR